MPKVALCMIVKNEEANLAACLAPVRGLVDEIVVVDTGSADRTREIAGEFGARVFEFPWCDDFSAARNESLVRADGDWAFWLDADDRVDGANVDKLGRLFAELNQPAGYYMTILGDESWRNRGIPQVRLFPLTPGVRWQYRVHEQIAPAILRGGDPLRQTDIVIRHTGYSSPEVMQQKWQRNLRMLLLDIAEHPDDPPTLFHLGMTYTLLSRHAEAVPLLQKALMPLRPHNPEARFVLRYLAESLRGMGRSDLAARYCRQGLQWFPDDVWLQALERTLASGPAKEAISVPQALNAARQHYQAAQFHEAEQRYLEVLQVDPHHVDALHQLGLIAGRTGRLDLAVRYLQASLQQKPDFASAHNNLGNVYVLQGKLPDAVASFRQAVRCNPDFAAAHSNLGNALREMGRLEEAVASLREALRLAPESAGARENLNLALQAIEQRN